MIARHRAVLIRSWAGGRPRRGETLKLSSFASSGNSLLSGARWRDGYGSTTQPLPIRRRVVALLESARRAAETLVELEPAVVD